MESLTSVKEPQNSGMTPRAPMFVPVNDPLLNGNEKKYLLECIESGWISSEGPFVKKLEEQFAARVNRKYGIAVANGSVALELALAALEIGPGDEVILPAFTIISCASAVVRAGATPVLVDCDPITWNMDPQQVADKITARTKAIMPVHIYGMPVDMDPIFVLADKHGLKIIEDAAEVHGQTYKGKPCGGFGDISCFSFFANKHIATGEGGMVLTNDTHLADRCKSLRNLCFGTKKRFVHEELGWNFRMTNLQAAVGVAQLERLDEFVEIKREMGRKYRRLLSDVPGLQLPIERNATAENVYWMYSMVLNDDVPFDAEYIMKFLGDRKIITRAFFWPMHEQPVFKKMGLFKGETYPVSERIARRGFYVPSGMALTDVQMEYVAGCLKDALN